MAAKHDEDLQEILTKNLASKLEKLYQVWDVIGLSPAQKTTRIEVVALHLNNLLDEMVTEEENLCERMQRNIRQYGDDIARLVQALGSSYEPPSKLRNIHLEKELKKKRAAFEEELRQRMTMYEKLAGEEDRLCVMTSSKILARCNDSEVPSWRQMEAMKAHVDDLESEVDDRRAIYRSTKAEIVDIVELLESSADTSFERELVCEDEQWFVPTADNMVALKTYHEHLQKRRTEHLALVSLLRGKMETLWKRLEVKGNEETITDVVKRTTGERLAVLDGIRAEICRCQQAMLERLQDVLVNIRTEIEALWDKCGVGQAEREEFGAMAAAADGEACLVVHENEVTRMLAYHDQIGEMLCLVERWQKLFEQFLENERRATNDPSRYSNRGGNLLKEEKARRRVEKTLPIVQEDVCRKIDIWEAATGQRFRIRGIPFGQFIQQSWDAHKQEKIKAKTDRLQAKATLMKAEMKFGSRPASTPSKKRLFANNLMCNSSKSKRLWNDKQSTSSLYDSTVSTSSGVSENSATPSKNSYLAKPRLYCLTPRNFSRC